MDTIGQFPVFVLCLAIGFLGGVLYELFSFVRLSFGCRHGKNRLLGGVVDLLFWISFSISCVFFAYAFEFPSIRAYMWIGYGIGGILYLKTLHKIIAFFENMCYNKIILLIKKAKKREKTLKQRRGKRYDARKNAKNDNGNRRRVDVVARDIAVRSHLSMDNDCGV